MRFLIDTHTSIWYVQNSAQLTTSVTAIINNGSILDMARNKSQIGMAGSTLDCYTCTVSSTSSNR